MPTERSERSSESRGGLSEEKLLEILDAIAGLVSADLMLVTSAGHGFVSVQEHDGIRSVGPVDSAEVAFVFGGRAVSPRIRFGAIGGARSVM